MDMNLRVKIQALRLCLANLPDKDMFHRGLTLAGQDADGIFGEVEKYRLNLMRQLSELESLARAQPRVTANVVYLSARKSDHE